MNSALDMMRVPRRAHPKPELSRLPLSVRLPPAPQIVGDFAVSNQVRVFLSVGPGEAEPASYSIRSMTFDPRFSSSGRDSS